MRTGGAERLILRLVKELPFLGPIYADHMALGSELLPHAFFFMDLRAVFDGTRHGLPHDAAKQILNIVEDELLRFDDEVVELINLSFFETLQNSDVLPRLKPWMGPNLLRIYPLYRAD